MLLYLSKSRFPLWSKESKALFPGPPRPLFLRPPLGPPRPLNGLSRSNLSTGLGKDGIVKSGEMQLKRSEAFWEKKAETKQNKKDKKQTRRQSYLQFIRKHAGLT